MKTVQALTACINPQKVSLYGMHRGAFSAAGFFVAEREDGGVSRLRDSMREKRFPSPMPHPGLFVLSLEGNRSRVKKTLRWSVFSGRVFARRAAQRSEQAARAMCKNDSHHPQSVVAQVKGIEAALRKRNSGAFLIRIHKETRIRHRKGKEKSR